MLLLLPVHGEFYLPICLDSFRVQTRGCASYLVIRVTSFCLVCGVTVDEVSDVRSSWQTMQESRELKKRGINMMAVPIQMSMASR